MRTAPLILVLCGALAACSSPCKEIVDCADNAHFEPNSCSCVADADAGTIVDASVPNDLDGCNDNCGGGNVGCASMCTGCSSGQLCCAWSPGVCLMNDAGVCLGESGNGYRCTDATAGLCPDQCFP